LNNDEIIVKGSDGLLRRVSRKAMTEAVNNVPTIGKPFPVPTPAPGPGLGDVVAGATKAVGIKPCGGCQKRQAAMNAATPGYLKRWLAWLAAAPVKPARPSPRP